MTATRSPKCVECGAELAVDRAGLIPLHTGDGERDTTDVCPGSRARPALVGLPSRAEMRRRMAR